MKTISVPTDWLHEIDGISVADAITYLSTLPKDHVLNYWMEGDTHGCDMRSELYYKRPYTPDELAQMAAERKSKRVAHAERSLAYNQEKAAYCRKANDSKWAEEYQRRADRDEQRLKELE